MDVFEAIRTRYSVRRYEAREVEQVKLDKVFEAARLAPSAKNLQEWRFVVARDPETIARLGEAAFQRFVGEAPIVIACCAEADEDYVMRCGLPSYPIDVAIAIDHMTLVATSLGLGTCWIGKFDPNLVREVLGIPSAVHVVELLLLGYPADSPPQKKRMALEEIIKYERW